MIFRPITSNQGKSRHNLALPCSAAERRPPERLAENAADGPAGDSANRTGDYEARTRTGGRADYIGASALRSRCDYGERCDCKNKVAHGFQTASILSAFFL